MWKPFRSFASKLSDTPTRYGIEPMKLCENIHLASNEQRKPATWADDILPNDWTIIALLATCESLPHGWQARVKAHGESCGWHPDDIQAIISRIGLRGSRMTHAQYIRTYGFEAMNG